MQTIKLPDPPPTPAAKQVAAMGHYRIPIRLDLHLSVNGEYLIQRKGGSQRYSEVMKTCRSTTSAISGQPKKPRQGQESSANTVGPFSQVREKQTAPSKRINRQYFRFNYPLYHCVSSESARGSHVTRTSPPLESSSSDTPEGRKHM